MERKEALETLIPELAESEDKMTCKRAIAILKQQRNFWSYDGPKDKFPPATLRKDLVAALDVALSCLEKQKEPTFISDLPPDDKGEPGENGILEKQKEQKPAEWSEDERIREYIINVVNLEKGVNLPPEDADRMLAYLEKQKVIAAIPDELVECYKNLCERGNRGVASLIDAINGFYGRKFAPKFRVGDVMRTKQEAAEEMTDGMPVVVSIDDDYYICNNERIPIADQEEYEFPPMNTGQQLVMIQWTGKNLKEVIDFTGKSPKFGEWFKSWEDFENYVHSHDGILKLFCEDGSHYEVPVGAWIVKTPDGYNIPSRFRFVQKPAEWSAEHIADVFEKVGLAKIAREQGNNELTNALQDAMLELSRMENAEWSAEDEKTLWGLTAYIPNEELKKLGVTRLDILKKFKSLRPSWKPSEVCYGAKGDPDPAGVWKPSEEQIHAIIEALKYLPNNKDEWRVLNTLVDVFRKLM